MHGCSLFSNIKAEKMEKQKTLRSGAAYTGITLHTGVRASLKINPGEPDTGIWFRRIDLPGAPSVQALAGNVVDVRRGTKIASGAAEVVTIEHVMACLHACGIDNAVVDMDGPEPPILDGSAKPYLDGILAAGIEEQDAEAQIFEPKTPICVNGGHTQMALFPNSDGVLRIFCTASFKGCPFDPQFIEMEITPDNFRDNIAAARTFVEFGDLRQLLAMGLVKGGSLDNAAILHQGAIICKDRLLWQDEIVRHKVLDMVGDLYLCGRRVHANVVAVKPGHPRNAELALAMQKAIANV